MYFLIGEAVMYLQKQKMPSLSIPQRLGMEFVSTPHSNIEAFQSLVKYLVKLRHNEDIDNNTFEGLMQQATATFVETEISERIERVLESRLSLDRLGSFG